MKGLLIFFFIIISNLTFAQEVSISEINPTLINLHEVDTGNENYQGFE